MMPLAVRRCRVQGWFLTSWTDICVGLLYVAEQLHTRLGACSPLRYLDYIHTMPSPLSQLHRRNLVRT